MKKGYVWLGVGLVALAGVYYLAWQALPRALVTMTKGTPGLYVSIKDSYVIGEKILARADGKDKCIVNVFLVDNRGRAVPSKSVVLSGMEGLTEAGGGTATTDNDGKASFELTSTKEGQFRVTAMVEGVPLPGGVTVTFRGD